jgi:uncharacterized membrane protein
MSRNNDFKEFDYVELFSIAIIIASLGVIAYITVRVIASAD